MPAKEEEYRTIFDVSDDYADAGVDENDFTPHAPKKDPDPAPKKDKDPDAEDLEKNQESEEEEESEEESFENTQLSPAEEKAVANGWMTEEDWKEAGNDPDDWVDARTFNMRGELLGKVYKERAARQQLEGRIGELQTVIKQLGDHNLKIAQREVDDAISTLRSQKAEAQSNEDYESVNEIDDRLDELKQAKQQLAEGAQQQQRQAQQQQPQVPPALRTWLSQGQAVMQDWMAQNPWFQKDSVMNAAASRLADEIVNESLDESGVPSITPEAMLSRVKMRMKQEFPQKFRSAGPRKPAVASGANEGRARAQAKTGKYSARDMSSEQRRIYKAMKEAGTPISESEYAAQLAKLGELPSQQR